MIIGRLTLSALALALLAGCGGGPSRGGYPYVRGQYLREENLTPPYRILPPRAIITKEFSAARVNVELDDQRRIIGLYCG